MSELQTLPEAIPPDLESLAILRQVILSNRYLAELKGAAGRIPNETILIDNVGLQEAKDSSAIENIITTQDALFQSDLFSSDFRSLEAKEVYGYATALRIGWSRTQEQRILRLPDVTSG